MSEESISNNSAPANHSDLGRGARPVNILAAFLGLFLFLSGIAMLLLLNATQIDRIFPILTSCCGLGLLFYAVGDEARIFSQSINIVGASAIALTVFFVWNKSVNEETRYKAEAYALWKDPKNAAGVIEGPPANKPHAITIGLKSRLIKGNAEENNEGNGYRFNLTLTDRDVSDFLDTACPFIRITFRDGRKKMLHFAKATRITPNDYNMFFILKYYLDSESISATRDKEFFLPNCNSDKDAAAKDARQIEKDETADGTKHSTAEQSAAARAPPPPLPPPQKKDEEEAKPLPKVIPVTQTYKDKPSDVIGYVILSRFNTEKPKRDKNWFDIEGKPEARFPAPGDTLRVIEDDAPLRGYPFRWDEKAKKHLQPSPPLLRLKKDQKLVVASDATLATDENNGDIYAIIPIKSIIGLTPPSGEVMPNSYLSDTVIGYTYIGYIDPASSEFNKSIFNNITKPDAVYPGPNDVLVANRGVWLRAGPRKWDAEQQVYIQDKEIKAIKKGQYIQLGGDVVLSKAGNSIWAPVARIYENGPLDFADKK